jgi:FkbM family methyltransferase
MLKALFYPDVPFDSLFIPYIYKEIYLESVYIDIFNTRKDMVVIDVGANIGVVTQYMRDFAKVVYAIEPSTEHFEALAKNVEFNKWTNVVPIKAAIAEKNGEMTLNLNEANRTCHSLNLKYGEKGEKVRVIDFETLFKENKIDKVDFVKFDVEGYEEPILMGESFKKVADKIAAIEVEFHFPTFPKIVEYMLKLGYKARRYDSSAVIILFFR